MIRSMKKKHILSWLLLAAVCLLFSACGGGGEKEQKNTVKEYLKEEDPEWCYVLDQSYEMPWDSAVDYSLICLDNTLYYVKMELLYEGEAAAEEELEDLLQEMEQNPEIGQKLSVRSQLKCREITENGLGEERVLYETDEYIEKILPDGSGKIDLICGELQKILDYRDDRTLLRLDESGKVLLKKDISDFYQSGLCAVDGEGRLAFWSNGTLYCLDEKGKKIKEEKLQGAVLELYGKPDGGFWAATLGEKGFEFKGISAQKGAEEESFLGVADVSQVSFGKDGRAILGGHTGLYEMNPQDGACIRLLKWMDLDILANDISGWWPTEDGRIGVILSGADGGVKSILSYQKVRREDVVQKEVLTMGTWSSVGSSLERMIVAFNRSNPKYRVNVLDYAEAINASSDTADWDAAKRRMEQDILSGNGPDIMLSDSLDLTNYAEKDAFENLEPYLMKSNAISADDFFEEVLEASMQNEKLILLPKNFSIQTLICKEKILGDASTWDIGTFLAVAGQYPEAEVAQYSPYYERNGMTGRMGQTVELALLLNQDYFADEGAKSCRFQEELFEKLLEFGAAQGKNDQQNPYSSELYSQDKRLFYRTDIYGFSSLRDIKNTFGKEEVRFIGFPAESGEKHHILTPRQSMLILASSKQKEGAWEFLEYYLTAEDGDGYSFAAQKKQFEEQKQNLLSAGAEALQIGEKDLAVIEDILHHSLGENKRMDAQILRIIDEEAQAVFQGQKSAGDAAKIIQNRAELYIKEK